MWVIVVVNGVFAFETFLLYSFSAYCFAVDLSSFLVLIVRIDLE